MKRNHRHYRSPYEPCLILSARSVPEEMAVIGASVGIALLIENVN